MYNVYTVSQMYYMHMYVLYVLVTCILFGIHVYFLINTTVPHNCLQVSGAVKLASWQGWIFLS